MVELDMKTLKVLCVQKVFENIAGLALDGKLPFDPTIVEFAMVVMAVDLAYDGHSVEKPPARPPYDQVIAALLLYADLASAECVLRHVNKPQVILLPVQPSNQHNTHM